MKKLLSFSILIMLLFTLVSFAQPKDAYLYEFLGKSKGQITNIWGNPERVDIDRSGYVVWYYTYNYDVIRTFYFYDSYVERAGSVIFINDYEYARALWIKLAENFETLGFIPYSKNKSVITVTNGRVYIDCRISKNTADYSIALLAYR
jgi:hypothetical protein